MIDLLLMGRTSQMLVQAVQLPKTLGAKIAAEPVSIPRSTGSICSSFRALVIMPSDLLVGKDMVSIDFAAVLVEFLPIGPGRARSRLEVQGHASPIGKF